MNVGLQAKRAESTVAVSVNVDQLNRYLALLEPMVAAGRAQPPPADGPPAAPAAERIDLDDSGRVVGLF